MLHLENRQSLGRDFQATDVKVLDYHTEVACVRVESAPSGEVIAWLYPAGENYFEQEPVRFVLRAADA